MPNDRDANVLLFIDATCHSDLTFMCGCWQAGQFVAGARESCEIPFIGAAVIKFFLLLFFLFFSFLFSPASIQQTSRMAGGKSGQHEHR